MSTPLRGLVVAGAVTAVMLASGVAAEAATAIPEFKAPKTFGTTFQADPKHDFTKHISPRHDGILRGWITYLDGGVAEYEPIRWKKDTKDQGHFEGAHTAYSSPIAKDVVFLSAHGCKSLQGGLTINRKTKLGAKRCSRDVLMKRSGHVSQPSLITIYKSRIVRVQEIYTP